MGAGFHWSKEYFMRLIGYLALIGMIVFGAWPYYHLYRLDDALGKNDTAALEQLIDVQAIRENYRARIEKGLGLQTLPQPQNPGSALAWLQQNLQRLGDAALDQSITLEWVRDSLKQAAAEASDEQPPYFLAGVDFAFFESVDSFIVRLGQLGINATHVRLSLRDWTWRVTDIIR
jgi:hypothetical protein